MMRAECLMLAGQCDAGKGLLRKQQEASLGINGTPEGIDNYVSVIAGKYCQGAMSQRDQLIKARMDLTQGYMSKKDPAFCKAAWDKVWALKDVVKPKDDDDNMVKDPQHVLLSMGVGCFVKAGDCDAAFKAYTQIAGELYKQYPWSRDPAQLRTNFEQMNQKCKK
jgi:hypothetical protein